MTPWEESPYSLISQYEMMIIFKAERFIGITQKITSAIRRIENSPDPHITIDPDAYSSWITELEKIEEDCRELSLEFVIDEIERIKKSGSSHLPVGHSVVRSC